MKKSISLYPREKEIPKIGDINKVAGHENDKKSDFETTYKIPYLHIPADTTQLTLTVVVEMPKDNDVNKKYKNYKKAQGEKNETIHFALARLNDKKLPIFSKDLLTYERETSSNLTLAVQSIEHPIDKSTQTYELTIDKNNAPVTLDVGIIAFYEKPNTSSPDAPKHREEILGQVNVIPSSAHTYEEKTSKYIASIQSSLQDIGLKFDPNKIVLDIQFVTVLSSPNNPPLMPQSADHIVSELNDMYRQLGIEFRLKTGLKNTNQNYINLYIPDSDLKDASGKPYQKDTYTIRDQIFIKTIDGITYSAPPETKIIKIVGGKSMTYYSGVNHNELLKQLDKNLFDYEFKQTKITGLQAYKDIKTKALENVLPQYLTQTLDILHERLKEYLTSRIFTVYLLNDLDVLSADITQMAMGTTGQTISKYTSSEQAFGVIRGNSAVFTKSAFQDIPYYFSHELGHCLGLYHSFPAPDNVDEVTYKPIIPYDYEWETKYLGCSYSNVMDYSGENSKYRASGFTNFQLSNIYKFLSEGMIKNITKEYKNTLRLFGNEIVMSASEKSNYYQKLQDLYSSIF